MNHRRAKIVATLGPASRSPEVIRQLILAGMDVARLNFSHGNYEDHAQAYANLRQIAVECGRTLTVLQDLQGPKIRVGKIDGAGLELTAGQRLILTTQPGFGSGDRVSVDFPQLLDNVQPGSRILMDDGNLEVRVRSVHSDHVETEVVHGGWLKSNKGFNLPGSKINIPGFTTEDEQDLAFGLKLGVDAVAISFVRSAEDVKMVRAAIQRLAPERDITVIAKLERPESLDNLEGILDVADGVMVARGDLGVEMAPETVPIAQKKIISAANKHARIVITATQMLDSMINSPRPTRAEASDVANAVFDGSDAVMLSGETAAGKYPVQSVRMMAAIICQAEMNMDEWGHYNNLLMEDHSGDDTFYITQAARELAHDRNVEAIAVFTKSGRTALLMSKRRPRVPILAFSSDSETCQRMNLFWGVRPHWVPHVDTIENMLKVVGEAMLTSTPLEPGNQVVLICGYPIHAVRATNLALLHTVGE